MSTSTHCIKELGRKARDIASELRSTGILNSDSYVNMQKLLKSDLRDKADMEGAENPEVWKTNCEELLKTLTEYSKLMEQYHLSTDNSGLKQKVEELERKVEELKREVKELQAKLKGMEKTLETSEGNREKKLEHFGRELGDLKKALKGSDYMMVGQLAHKVESKIVDHVLTEVIGPPKELYITSLTNLQQVLNREQNFTQPLQDDEKCEEAKKRWEELRTRIGWTEHHYRCIEFLKAYRIHHATASELDITVLKTTIRECATFPHRSECEELLSMLDKISQVF
jgi:predicted transcriptional regulator